MIIQETNRLMSRIKEHYQDFIIDEGKIEEWHNYLKDYSYRDVTNKLDEHLGSEQYGQYIPKVAFLTKYLIKEKDKDKIKDYYTSCMICGNRILISNYDQHYKRCSSVEYLENQYYKYTTKHLNKNVLFKMEEDTFKKKYREMLELIKDNTDNEEERERIKAILNNDTTILQTSFLKVM